MSDDKEATPDDDPEPLATSEPPPRSMPTRRDNSERALGLEMARLFGLPPKLMMAPEPTPKPPPEPPDDGDEDGPPAA